MKILFLCDCASIAGVETLMCRMAMFCPKDWEFIFFFFFNRPSPEILEKLKKTGCIVINGGNFRLSLLCNTKKKLQKIFQSQQLNHIDFIYSVHCISFIYAHFIKKHNFPNAKILTGVYHPTEYGWHSKKKNYLERLMLRVLSKTSPENIFFMNQDVRNKHSELIGLDFSKSPITPIGIDFLNLSIIIRNPKKFKIVSVGRLCDFKTYNFLMLDVMQDLHRADNRFTYHIYGHGKLEKKIKNEIKIRNLENIVFFHGKLPYEKYSEVMQDAFIFIGMGTALIEAAASGVPALIAIEREKEAVTYGWFYLEKGYNIGEFVFNKNRFKFFDLIFDISKDTEEHYLNHSKLSKIKAEEFSILNLIDGFTAHASRAKETKTNISWWEYFCFCVDFKFNYFLKKCGRTSSYSDHHFSEEFTSVQFNLK
ncbi:MAG: glycosyltransferase [Gammaproteobacteria bacterium]|nr:glycosyltransferase [Gammaproteobacteria bacterium]